MRLCCIPGLGFDRRIFAQLELGPQPCQFLEWVDPLDGEDFHTYVLRMASGIDSEPGDTVLLGHSLGGLACLEIASTLSVKAVFLISSIKSRAELPQHFKIIYPSRLYQLFTKEMTLGTSKFWAKEFDYGGKEVEALFNSMISMHSNTYLQWALKSLSIWSEPTVLPRTPVFHLHGERDRTFPFSLIQQADFVLPQGGHFMIYKYPKPISAYIRQELNQLAS